MSEQIPQDPERQEGGGVEGAVEDLDAPDDPGRAGVVEEGEEPA
jgi:hypothetical protein